MKIILASQSPRRRALLKLMGLEFDVIPSKFEEYFDDNRPVDEVVEELGLGKALDVAKDQPDDIVIGSDLIVVIDGKQIGKPETVQEAKQMLRNISGRTHQLIASVAVVCLSRGYQKVEHETAEVEFNDFTEEFIDKYVATGSTYDKASGYAIQHPLVIPYIASIRGNKDTIIGLPTKLVAKFLKELGINTKGIDTNSTEFQTNNGFID